MADKVRPGEAALGAGGGGVGTGVTREEANALLRTAHVGPLQKVLPCYFRIDFEDEVALPDDVVPKLSTIALPSQM